MGSFDVLTPMKDGTIARQHNPVMWMNEDEISEASFRHAKHPILGPAARVLVEVRDQVNSCSDGWPYWKAPGRACRKLMALLQGPPTDATEAAFRAALTPIKSFYTRHGYTFPEVR